MEDILQAILLGLIQGLTEFLPVSSTGHLILAEKALGLDHEKFGLRFDAAIHLGTLAAVLVYFRPLVASITWQWLRSLAPLRRPLHRRARLAWLLILGTIPGGIAGYFLESTAEDQFRSPALVAVMLIIFSLPMLAAEKLTRGEREVANAGRGDAIALGLAQAVALVPGVSRSGITMTAAMMRGFSREEAAVFAFLLSAPIIAAAGFKQLFDILRGESASLDLANEYTVYTAGMISAACVGYAAIYALLRFLRGNPLNLFIGYRITLGVIVLALVAGGIL